MIKSLSIASHNWKVLLKSLFCQVLVLVLMLAFVVTAFGALAGDILRVVTEIGIADFISSTASAIISGEFNSADFSAALTEMINALRENISTIRWPWGGVTMSYIVVALTLIVYRLLVSYADVTAACQIEEFMTSNARRPFMWFLLKKQGRTWAFSCLQLLCALPLDILIVTGTLGLYLLFLVAFGWWTIIPAVCIMVVLYAARHTFFAFCLPAVVCEDMSTRKAFKRGVSLIVNRFWRVFWKTLIVICVMLVISVVGIMYVDNGWAQTAVITVPNFVLFFYLKCVNMREYLEANNRPYFHKTMCIEGTDRYIRRQKRLEAKQAKKSARSADKR